MLWRRNKHSVGDLRMVPKHDGTWAIEIYRDYGKIKDWSTALIARGDFNSVYKKMMGMQQDAKQEALHLAKSPIYPGDIP